MMEQNQTMNNANHTILDRRLMAVWRREQLLLLLRGGLVAVRWGLILFLAAVLLDWLIGLPSIVRAVILLGASGGTLFLAWKAGWNSMRRFHAVHAALQVERMNGGMESLLVSAVQLRKSAPTDALVQLVCSKAEKLAETIRPSDAVKFGLLKRPAVIAGAAMLLLMVLSMTIGGLLTAGLGRIITPWAAIEYPTRTQLILTERDQVVKEGSPVAIVAQVSGVIPSEATIAVRTGSGKPLMRSLPVSDGRIEYAMESAYRGFEYRIKAGDARTPWHRVEVIQSPTIRKAAITIQVPEYIQRPPETVDALTLTVPETTRILWKLTLDRPVKEAHMNVDGQEPVPMQVSMDGLTVSHDRVVTETRAYHFSWVDRKHGFAFTSLNHYLQVAPDRAPRVELVSPVKNIYATLGRKVDLAFRASDDYGIGETNIAYRIDKTEETKVPFTPAAPVDGTVQAIGWDYREALPDLTVGQMVSFAVEVADRYPVVDGTHRARSDTRWIQFLSREDYLAQVEKLKVRQLSELKALYREERKVHEEILRLDPADPVFMQSCQLEAVRQDLMRERVSKLAVAMQDLIDDLAANQITDYPGIDALSSLRKEVLRIAEQNLAATAPALRSLGGETGKAAPVVAEAKAKAVAALDDTSRELGLLVLQLGYKEAAEVMAQEYHAAAITQAALRLRTIMLQEDSEVLAADQENLAAWLKRLFAASPKDKESTIEEALTAFTLSRVVKKMTRDGMESRLQQATDLIRKKSGNDAAKLQSESIQALLVAESRLRVGAERDALVTAKALYESIVEEQAKIRAAMEVADDKTNHAAAQEILQRKLQLLLMPQVPARRVRLFDVNLPTAPPVAELLTTADDAMKHAIVAIAKGERVAARKDQEIVESSFKELASISKDRILSLSQMLRISRFGFAADELDSRFGRYYDRLEILLEETGDAAAGETQSNTLAERQNSMVEMIQQQLLELNTQMQDSGAPSEFPLALPECLSDIAQSLQIAGKFLEAKKPNEAVPYQESALANIGMTRILLSDHRGRLGAYGGVSATVEGVEIPSPFIAEIIEEQRDLLEACRKAKDDELPQFAVSQKNLVHAVNATLGVLASVSEKVESGTVMLFAKEDMQAAAAAMLAKDPIETIDAQEYIIETVEQLRVKIADVVSQHRYILEISEATYEASHNSVLLLEAQRRLRVKAETSGADAAALAREQAKIKADFQPHTTLLHRITGMNSEGDAVAVMTETESLLAQGDIAASAAKMAQAEMILKSNAAAVSNCMKQIGLIFEVPDDAEKNTESALLGQVWVVAAKHKDLLRENAKVDAAGLKAFESKLRGFEQSIDPFIPIAQEHGQAYALKAAADAAAAAEMAAAKAAKARKKPAVAVEEKIVVEEKPLPTANFHLKLIAAKQAFAEAAVGAAAGDHERALCSQEKASESLRHFIVEYALIFLAEGGSGAPPPPPAEAEVFTEKQDEFELFMPGSVSGERPPDSKADWQVLGARQRAALNENFARELPLEHRDTLKNYFERLTE